MNSREIIEKALNFEETDILPVDFGSTFITGISASIVSKLRNFYGLDNKDPVKIIEPLQLLGEIKEDLKKIIGTDCIEIWGKKNIFGFDNDIENPNWKEWELSDGTPVRVPAKFNIDHETNGGIYQYPEGDKSISPSGYMPKGGFYFDAIIRQKTIDDDKLNIEDNLEEFNSISDEDLEYFEKRVDFLYKNFDYAIVGTFGGKSFGDISLVPGTFLRDPKGIRDITEWYVSLIKRKNFISEIFNRQCEIALKNLEKIYHAILNKISVIYITGTDFGTQNGPFISKELYIELFKPFHKRINEWIHKNTKWKTFMHTCGGIAPLIEEFIDAGFDILNPMQFSAKGMDIIELKEKYGKKIVFWGGGVDTQKTLPFGTKDEVKEEVKNRIEILSKGGGFVFSSIHNVQAKTPIENVVAMIEVIKQFK